MEEVVVTRLKVFSQNSDFDDENNVDKYLETRYDNDIGLMNYQEVEEFLDEWYGVDIEDEYENRQKD